MDSTDSYYKSHLDVLAKENKALRSQMDTLKKENVDLKKSLLMLNQRFQAAVSTMPQHSVPAFSLDFMEPEGGNTGGAAGGNTGAAAVLPQTESAQLQAGVQGVAAVAQGGAQGKPRPNTPSDSPHHTPRQGAAPGAHSDDGSALQRALPKLVPPAGAGMERAGKSATGALESASGHGGGQHKGGSPVSPRLAGRGGKKEPPTPAGSPPPPAEPTQHSLAKQDGGGSGGGGGGAVSEPQGKDDEVEGMTEGAVSELLLEGAR